MGASASKTSSNTSSAQTTQTNSGAPNLSAGGNLAINTDVSPQIAQGAFDAIQALVGQALTTQGAVNANATQTVQNQTGDLSNLVSAVLAKDQTAAADTASGGQTSNNSTILEVVGIAAAAIVAILLFRPSRS